MEIEWNENGLRELDANIRWALDGVTVPIEGTQEGAVADVESQLIAKGIEPNSEGVAEYVRQARHD